MGIPNYPINSLARPDRNLIPARTPTNARSLIILVPSYLSQLQSKAKLLFSSKAENTGKKGVADLGMFFTSDRFGKNFGVSGDLLGHNARGIALLTLKNLKNPRLTGLGGPTRDNFLYLVPLTSYYAHNYTDMHI